MTGLLNRILNHLAKIAKYAVVETGTNYNWKYKKYADGTYTATYTLQHSSFNINQGPSAGEYYSGDIWVANRPSFAKTVSGAIATPFGGTMSSGPRVYRIVVDANNAVRCQFRAQASLSNVSVNVAYMIWGTW